MKNAFSERWLRRLEMDHQFFTLDGDAFDAPHIVGGAGMRGGLRGQIHAGDRIEKAARQRTAVYVQCQHLEMHLPVRASTFLECGEAIERGAHRREEKK